MTLVEFIPFVIACSLAVLIAWAMFAKFGWVGLVIGSILGLLVIGLGIVAGIWLAAKWWPRTKKNTPK